MTRRNKCLWLKKCIKALIWVWDNFVYPQELGYCGKNTILQYPMKIYNPSNVYIYENVRITHGLKIINSPVEKVIIKKYSVLAADCTIITNNHKSTVTIPQFILSASHVNDKSADVVIGEDVWIGANVTILAGVHIGRGCVVGANSLVTKDFPPYSVVQGSPARIVKKTFSNEQILIHEKVLYSQDERMNVRDLEELNQEYLGELDFYGVAGEFSRQDIMSINKTKEYLHFIAPQL